MRLAANTSYARDALTAQEENVMKRRKQAMATAMQIVPRSA